MQFLSAFEPLVKYTFVYAFVINLPMKVQIRHNIWFAARFSFPKEKLN